jgi:general secretion pathway protein E
MAAASALGELLVAAGVLTPEGYARAARARAHRDAPLDRIVTELGLASEIAIAQALAASLELELVRAAAFPAEPPAALDLSPAFLRKARALPMLATDDALVVAMADPSDRSTIDALAFAVGRRIEPRVALPSELEAAAERLFGGSGAATAETEVRTDDAEAHEDVERLKDRASDAPIIRLVDRLIANAVDAGASDIHIEPMDSRLRVRYRIDGVLHEIDSRTPGERAPIVSRIKIMAGLDIAERRLAQDGRMRVPVRGKAVDFRVATSPGMLGESVVLRILDRGNLALDFDTLGFEADVLARYRRMIERPHGVVLITGPTGSGKTTTLYTSLIGLNTPDRKILTIEDPIEYQLDGINQHQVKPQIDYSFATALRSFLRQDPDIMMVGEIRDRETAQIAVQAALTGHLVLSTLHTNDAASAIGRLLDMGVDDYLLTSTVNGLVGQRLVRVLCPFCRESFAPARELAERLRLAELAGGGEIALWRSRGCARCRQTGFGGRTMIVETLAMSEAIRALVLQRAGAQEIQRVAVAEGMLTMYRHGLRKALHGVTTVEEVLRATAEA